MEPVSTWSTPAIPRGSPSLPVACCAWLKQSRWRFGASPSSRVRSSDQPLTATRHMARVIVLGVVFPEPCPYRHPEESPAGPGPHAPWSGRGKEAKKSRGHCFRDLVGPPTGRRLWGYLGLHFGSSSSMLRARLPWWDRIALPFFFARSTGLSCGPVHRSPPRKCVRSRKRGVHVGIQSSRNVRGGKR